VVGLNIQVLKNFQKKIIKNIWICHNYVVPLFYGKLEREKWKRRKNLMGKIKRLIPRDPSSPTIEELREIGIQISKGKYKKKVKDNRPWKK